MTYPLFVQEIDKRGVARITLTRAEVHNAFNEVLIAELTAALDGIGQDPRVRAERLGLSQFRELRRELDAIVEVCSRS